MYLYGYDRTVNSTVRPRAKVTRPIELTAYRKSYMRNQWYQMNDLDLCIEVV